MGGKSVVLLAVGLFASLVVAVAGIHQYLLRQHPPSEASGLLWRVESALGGAQDLQIDLTAVDHTTGDTAVRMTVHVLVGPIPALSVHYTEPSTLAGEIVVVQNDLLSHYIPLTDTLVVRRWTGIPLAAVGLAGLDVSRLRTAVAQGTVTARVIEEIATLSSSGSAVDISLPSFPPAPGERTIGTLVDPSLAPLLPGLIPTLAPDTLSPTRDTYIIEVRDATSGKLTQVLWVDRGTYFIRKVLFYTDDRLTRSIEVERLLINQGLTPEDVLTLPRASVTVRG